MASLKVGSCWAYQAAPRGRRAVACAAIDSPARGVTGENDPSRAGVVCRMAWSDHCRWVSSRDGGGLPERRIDAPPRDEAAQDLRRCVVEVRTEEGRGSRWPDGSRTSTQRSGAGGRPAWYQTRCRNFDRPGLAAYPSVTCSLSDGSGFTTRR